MKKRMFFQLFKNYIIACDQDLIINSKPFKNGRSGLKHIINCATLNLPMKS